MFMRGERGRERRTADGREFVEREELHEEGLGIRVYEYGSVHGSNCGDWSTRPARRQSSRVCPWPSSRPSRR